jgi:hypothetical protein
MHLLGKKHVILKTNETYHCQSCNKIVTISNRINHENTEFHKNNSSYKTFLRCNLKLNKKNFT